MTADEILKLEALRDIAKQLAEQNECSHTIISLWGDAKKRDEDNIARIAKMDEDLQKARVATEGIAQKYWKMAAEVEQAKRDLWKPARPTTDEADPK